MTEVSGSGKGLPRDPRAFAGRRINRPGTAPPAKRIGRTACWTPSGPPRCHDHSSIAPLLTGHHRRDDFLLFAARPARDARAEHRCSSLIEKEGSQSGQEPNRIDRGGRGGSQRSAEDCNGRAVVVLCAPPRSSALLCDLCGQCSCCCCYPASSRCAPWASLPAPHQAKGKQQHARNRRMHGGTGGSSAAQPGIDPPCPILPSFPCMLLSCRCQPPRGTVRVTE